MFLINSVRYNNSNNIDMNAFSCKCLLFRSKQLAQKVFYKDGLQYLKILKIFELHDRKCH